MNSSSSKHTPRIKTFKTKPWIRRESCLRPCIQQFDFDKIGRRTPRDLSNPIEQITAERK